MKLNQTKIHILFYLFAGLLSSCVSQKDMIYLQDKAANHQLQTFDADKSAMVIRAHDQVYLQVNSLDDGKLNFMSNDANRYGGGRSEADLAMVSYTVDAKGFIDLPIIGKFNVIGLTANQASEKIREELELYLNTPSVKVSFVNKSITILGDVNQPGRYFFASEYLNVMQAIGMAGDITQFGNRKYIVLIREENERISKKRIDLTNIDLLTSADYYLRPNDILYVEPMSKRKWGMATVPWALILSSITTFVLVADYIKNN